MNRTDNPEAFDHLIDVLAARILSEQHAAYRAQYPDSPHMHDYILVTVKPRKLYTLIDVGPDNYFDGKPTGTASSGCYMVEHATGVIFGIKGYGVVHRGHSYGTLETMEEWAWGGYRAGRKKESA